MKWPPKLVLVPLFTVAMIASAQSSTQDRGLAQETQVRGHWTDPSTGLTWAGKDNGKDVDWHKAMNYCRDLRLAGYSDWRLPTIDELEGIYERYTSDSGQADSHGSFVFGFRVKGKLALTGFSWSSTRGADSRGRPSGTAYRADPLHGRFADDLGYKSNLRALCVRQSGK
jgi:hypothetical protein